MKGTYRKEGASARVTTLRGGTVETTARESGIAGFSGGRFFSASVEAREEIHGALLDEARSLHERARAAAGRSGRIERLRVVTGAASHRFEPDEGPPRAWSETQAVLHLALLAPSGARISVLRGGASAADIDTREIASIAAALASAQSRPPIERGTIVSSGAPVSAAIAAAIARHGDRAAVSVVQQVHPDFEMDGEGRPILRFEPAGTTAEEWPNVFRPSYRSPASPALMHVEIPGGSDKAAQGTIEVIELFRPPHVADHAVMLDALCSRGKESFFCSIEMSIESVAAAPAAGPRLWFPFHAGAWGRRMSVEGARIR